jgi:hypothetical protein
MSSRSRPIEVTKTKLFVCHCFQLGNGLYLEVHGKTLACDVGSITRGTSKRSKDECHPRSATAPR